MKEPSVLNGYERFKARVEGWSFRARTWKWPFCWPRHAWSEWQLLREGNIVDQNGKACGYYKAQQRECDRCKKLEGRKVEW